jgi:hypothetical protein
VPSQPERQTEADMAGLVGFSSRCYKILEPPHAPRIPVPSCRPAGGLPQAREAVVDLLYRGLLPLLPLVLQHRA